MESVCALSLSLSSYMRRARERGTCLDGPPGASNWSRKENENESEKTGNENENETRRSRRRLENPSCQVGERCRRCCCCRGRERGETEWGTRHYINAPICPLFQILFVFVNETMSLRRNCVIPEAPSAYMRPHTALSPSLSKPRSPSI